MKNLLLQITLILLLNIHSIANTTNIEAAYAIGIFDEKGNGENIQHTRFSKNDYNKTCFSKIVIFGEYDIKNVKVSIGKSIGHFIKSKTIFNKQKIKIAEELTFKHYGVTKGYFEIKISKKLYDTKVFIK